MEQNNKGEREPMGELLKRQHAGLILLDRLVTQENAFHAALLESEDDHLLDDTFKYLMSEEIVEIADNDYYQATERGRKAYQNLLHQQQSYLAHFDIFARVDMAEGQFADQESDYLDDPRWTDMRVAVAEYKGIDPHRMVFLAMLAEERFFDNPDWKFDLALGSSFFTELEEIVASQTTIGELGYLAEDGGRVSGENVIEDVILQGSKLNKERMERFREREQQSFLDEEQNGGEEDNGHRSEGELVYVPYDPWMPMGGYMGSALFVEALWLSSFW